MNRNTELHFAELPSVGIGRSKFDRSHTRWGTMNAGKLYPIYVDTTIMPGDTVKMRTSELVRMMTPATPVMDDCFMDTYFFFVPYRLVWDDFKKFMGENETAPWTQTTEYTVPQVKCDYSDPNSTGWCKGIMPKSLGDYFGYPVFMTLDETPESTELNPEYVEYEASVLPFRAYCLIWNEFFRDENLQNPVHIYKDSVNRYAVPWGSTNYDPITDTELGGGECLNVCKVADMFTTCLPQPQKGPAVTLPMNGTAPIKTRSFEGEYQGSTYDYGNDWPNDNLYINHGSGADTSRIGKVGSITGTTNIDFTIGSINAASGELYADLSTATGATINALRQAFAVQKFYERQARGGTRYIEMVKSHFGVTNPDFRMQRPEYLGGHRTPININQVVGTSTTSYNDLGATGAYSLTLNQEGDLFTHSFTEHGILIGLACIRQRHSYCQGLNRQFSMKKLTDFYFPEFANLGEQAVLNKEIFVGGNSKDDEAFGYQEAWAHYRYYPDQSVGDMRTNVGNSLGNYWTYTDKYSERPTLGDTWINETDVNIQRTIITQSEDQFMFNMYFGAVYTRPMPLYSIPGLIDHH